MAAYETAARYSLFRSGRWYASETVIAEYALVLARPKLKIRRSSRQQLLQLIKNRARIVVPSTMPQITSDPSDNISLECADAARADYLVTGNQRHFARLWKNTKIISSSGFLSVIAPHLFNLKNVVVSTGT